MVPMSMSCFYAYFYGGVLKKKEWDSSLLSFNPGHCPSLDLWHQASPKVLFCSLSYPWTTGDEDTAPLDSQQHLSLGLQASGTNPSAASIQEVPMAMVWHSSLTSVPLLLVLSGLLHGQLIVIVASFSEVPLFVTVAQARVCA